MKTLLAVVLLAVLGSGVGFASDLDGIWNLTFIHDGDAHAEVISLRVDGTKVTGKWWDDEISGVCEGDDIRLEFLRAGSRNATKQPKTKKTLIKAKIYDRKVMMGTITGSGSDEWHAPLLLTRARVAEPGGASELDGSWNIHIKMEAKSQDMLGEIWPLVFHFKVDGDEVSGYMWDQHVSGIFRNGELVLDFANWNQLFTDDFRMQAQVKDGRLEGQWRHGMYFGSCSGYKASY